MVASMLLDDPRCCAVRLIPRGPDNTSTAGAGRTDLLTRVSAITTGGRLFEVSVVHADDEPPGGLNNVPAWTFPGPFANALAEPDPRHWVALTSGNRNFFAVKLARDYWLRRIVMARHLEAARAGVRVALQDDAITLDPILDLGNSNGMLVRLEDMITDVGRDARRRTDELPTPQL